MKAVFLYVYIKKSKKQTNRVRYEKVYIETVVKFLATGGMRPQFVIWTDGSKYQIDKVKSIMRAPAQTGGLLTDRYVCLLGDKERNLYFEKDQLKWFVEREIK